MKQTAIEWLCNEWLYIDQEFDMKLIDKKTYWERLKSVQEQAKAMEKEQIMDAYNISWALRDKPYATADKYYNETFKSE